MATITFSLEEPLLSLVVLLMSVVSYYSIYDYFHKKSYGRKWHSSLPVRARQLNPHVAVYLAGPPAHALLCLFIFGNTAIDGVVLIDASSPYSGACWIVLWVGVFAWPTVTYLMIREARSKKH